MLPSFQQHLHKAYCSNIERCTFYKVHENVVGFYCQAQNSLNNVWAAADNKFVNFFSVIVQFLIHLKFQPLFFVACFRSAFVNRTNLGCKTVAGYSVLNGIGQPVNNEIQICSSLSCHLTKIQKTGCPSMLLWGKTPLKKHSIHRLRISVLGNWHSLSSLKIYCLQKYQKLHWCCFRPNIGNMHVGRSVISSED